MIETRSVAEQLLQLCQQDLARGRWAVGDRFPSERELAQVHGISRATANKVLAKLVSEGWLEIRRGQGAFIAERPTLFAALRQLESFTDFAENIGLRPCTKVLQFRSKFPGESALKNQLGIGGADTVVYIKRRRELNSVPVIFEERWLPGPHFEGLSRSDLNGSFYRLCRERYHFQIERESVVVTAEMAPEIAAFGGQSSALCLEGFGYSENDRVLWKQRIYYRGDCFQLNHVTDSIAAFPRLSFQLRESFLSQHQT
ncbi:MAG: GntR family transcriptional regulator [Verrucomicrobiales bacterium]